MHWNGQFPSYRLFLRSGFKTYVIGTVNTAIEIYLFIPSLHWAQLMYIFYWTGSSNGWGIVNSKGLSLLCNITFDAITPGKYKRLLSPNHIIGIFSTTKRIYDRLYILPYYYSKMWLQYMKGNSQTHFQVSMAWSHAVKFLSVECRRTPLVMGQLWFR